MMRITELDTDDDGKHLSAGIVIRARLADGRAFNFFTTNGEGWAYGWPYAGEPTDDAARPVAAELKRVWNNDEAFEAVATSHFKHIRRRLVQIWADRAASRSNSYEAVL